MAVALASAAPSTLSPDGLWWWDGTRWQPTAARAHSWYRPIGTLTAWVTALVIANAVGSVLTVPLNFVSSSATTEADKVAASLLGLGFDVVFLPVGLAMLVVFCVWLYRVARNLPALRATELEFRPGWAVGWWFIPFANLVQPFRVMMEIWRASDPSTGATDRASRARLPVAALLPLWWGLWLGYNVIGDILAAFNLAGGDLFGTGPLLVALFGRAVLLNAGALDVLVGLGASITWVIVVRAIAARQGEKHRLLQARGVV